MSGPAGTACCETFVEALGLKNLFSTFMGKVTCIVSYNCAVVDSITGVEEEQNTDGGHLTYSRNRIVVILQSSV